VTAPTASGLLIPAGVTVEKGHGLGTNWFDQWTEDVVPEMQWPFNLPIFTQMAKGDPQCKSVLRAVSLPVTQTRWRLEPRNAPDEVVTFVSQNLGLPIVGSSDEPETMPRERDRFSWTDHLGEALLMTRWGHMPFEQVYRFDETSGKYFLRKLAARWPRTIERFETAPDGGLQWIEQRRVAGDTRQGNIKLGIDRLVMYVHEKEGGDWTGNSLLRPAYGHWLLKRQALRSWSVRDDRNSMGVPVYQAAPQETSLDRGLQLARDHRSGATAGAAVPSGANFRLQGVEGQLPDVEKQVRYHDESIRNAVLAHFLNLGQQSGTGSYALGSSFLDFFVMSLQSLGQQIASTATMHIVEDLVDLNFGTEVQAPRVVFDPIGQSPNAVNTAVQMLIAAGAVFPDPDLDAFVRQVNGLPPKAPLPGARTPAGAAEPPAGTPGT
jgi:hypothetical protein